MTETSDPLDGRRALVTGASSGIGRATAVELARDGADVALAARSADRLETAAATLRDQHDVRAVAVPTDVRDESAVAEMVETTVAEFGGLDLVVNNAGVLRGEGLDLATEDYRTMMETHVDGTFFTTRAAMPHLRESAGNLVFVGSFAANYPRPTFPVYAGAKWWLKGFAKSVESLVGDDGVAVTLINPAEVRTELEVDGRTLEDIFDEDEVTSPAEVGRVIAFAVAQPSALSEINLYTRDRLADFKQTIRSQDS